MSSPARRILVPLLLAGSVARMAFGQVPSGKDPVGAARELYASARYDEALAVLNDLKPTDTTPITDRRSIEQYRSLCLLALGREAEAEGAIGAVVTADPSYQPSETEASPRARSGLRSKGLRRRSKAIPPCALAARRPRHGRPSWRSANAIVRIPGSQRRGRRASIRTEKGAGRRGSATTRLSAGNDSNLHEP